MKNVPIKRTGKSYPLGATIFNGGVNFSIYSKNAKKLFTKFTRGKKSSAINTSGSGLGLFIAKKIVELHQGKIWVESQGEGKGSQFIFELPVN